jgi:GT2 family glycosyltransferase/glycosyltransferase involved in cell wall biosynthesis
MIPPLHRAAPRNPSDSVTEETIARLRAKTAVLAHDAWEQGYRAFAAGDAEAACRWLERARSLAPADRTIGLVLAMAQLQLGDAAALASFEAVTAADDLRAGWLGLAASRRMAGDRAGAADALHRGLSTHAATADTALGHLADSVAAEAGRAGWCSLAGDGMLTVGGVKGTAALTASLDGRVLNTLQMPPDWPTHLRIEVLADGATLIGSPLRIDRIRRCEGFVACRDGGLAGWAWFPNDPESDPTLLIGSVAKPDFLSITVRETEMTLSGHAPLARPRSFRLDDGQISRVPGPIHVWAPDRRDLLGSPLDPAAEARSAAALAQRVGSLFPAAPRRKLFPVGAFTPVNADLPPPSRDTGAIRARAIAVVVPVFRGVRQTIACLDQLSATIARNVRIIIVDDCSPEPELTQAVARRAQKTGVRLIRHPENRGFPASANSGMRAASRADIVLLNSDTLVAEGWLERLRDVAYSAEDIGTVTPFANDATILNYPDIEGGNAVPNLTAVRNLAALAHRANPGGVVDIPTAVGFCMYIRRDCLDEVGLLREDVFAQGYGEENDFCLRARHLGWRHVAAAGVFVGHVGGQSFGDSRRHLIARNMAVLNRLHPGYAELIETHQSADPLAPARRRLDVARWRATRGRRQPSVLLISHDMGGGVQRQIEARRDALAAKGKRVLVLQPVPLKPGLCRLSDGSKNYPNLRFRIPGEFEDLVGLLAKERLEYAEVHHLVGHDHRVLDIIGRLGLPYDVHLHDYAWFCPRISLIGADRRYCGEPEVAQCEICVADAGRNIEEDISTHDLVVRSAIDLAGARQVIAPSADAASRMARHFPAISPVVVPWETDPPLPPAARGSRIERVVCVIGAIGVEKGYDILLACAREAQAQARNIRFVVVGYTIDDERLLQTGRVFVTGEYRPEALQDLVAKQQADLAWLPSIWPETWSFVLTEAWRAGLDVAAFDIGAPAERIRRRGGGLLLPLGLPPAGLNRALLAHTRQP